MKLTAQAVYQAWPDSDLLPIVRPKHRESLRDWWDRAKAANDNSEFYGDFVFTAVIRAILDAKCQTTEEAAEVARSRSEDLMYLSDWMLDPKEKQG